MQVLTREESIRRSKERYEQLLAVRDGIAIALTLAGGWATMLLLSYVLQKALY